MRPRVLYLYAIAEPPGAAPGVAGLDGRPLRAVVSGGLAAVCSEHVGGPPEASADAVRRHGQVVEALAERAPVLPARFGTVFADADAVRSALDGRADGLSAALRRVRGRVELGVRILESASDPSGEPAADGRSYLLARLEQQRRTASLVDELHGALSSLAAAATLRTTPGARMLVSCAYLVDRDAVERFRRRVEELARERPTIDLVLTGPWPPYSFTGPEQEAS